MNLLEQAEADEFFLEKKYREYEINNHKYKIYDSSVGENCILFIPMIKEINILYVPLLKYFEKHHRVVLYEPNVSRSEYFGVVKRSDEINNILQILKLKKVNLVAWSDTCATAYYYAKQFSENCTSITFLGIAPTYRLPQPYHLLVGLLHKFPMEYLMPSILSSNLLSVCLGGTDVKYSWLAGKSSKIPSFTRLLKFSIIPNLIDHKVKNKELKIPTLIVCGAKDFLALPNKSAEVASLIPNSKMEIIHDAEHFFVYTHHHEVQKIIEKFYTNI